MKKIKYFIVFVLFCFMANSVFAQSIYEGKKIIVQSPKMQNLGDEKNWLGEIVQSKLKENFSEYIKFVPVKDKAEASKFISEISSAAKSNIYNDDQTEISGDWDFADYVFVSKIEKNNYGYKLSGDLRNLSSGKIYTVSSSFYASFDELIVRKGAADEITLKLCNVLGINLLSYQKNELEKSKFDLNKDEQLSQLEKNILENEKQLEEYKNKLEKIKYASNIADTLEKEKLETAEAMLKEKILFDKKLAQNLEERRLKELEDEKKEMERSVQQKKDRDALIAEIEKIEASQKNQIKTSHKLSPVSEIKILESKKKTFLEIQNRVEEDVKNILEQAEDEIQKETNLILNEPYLDIELDPVTKRPSEAAIAGRKNEAAVVAEEKNNRAKEDCKNIYETVKAPLTSLYNAICDDQKNLGYVRTASTENGELSVSYGTFDSIKGGWKVYLYFYSDDLLIYTKEILLSYKSVTGKNEIDLKTASTSEKVEYQSEIDKYNSIFAKGKNLFNYSLSYRVKPDSVIASSYIFEFFRIEIFSVLTGFRIQKNDFNDSKSVPFYPVYNVDYSFIDKNLKYEQKVIVDKKTEPIKERSEWAEKYVDNKNYGDGFRTGMSLVFSLSNSSSPLKNTFGERYSVAAQLTYDQAFAGNNWWSLFAGGSVAIGGGDKFYFNALGEAGICVGSNGFTAYAKTGAGLALNGFAAGNGIILRETLGFDLYYVNLEYSVDYVAGGGFADTFNIGLSLMNKLWPFYKH